jgi:hypothetical protein
MYVSIEKFLSIPRTLDGNGRIGIGVSSKLQRLAQASFHD